MGRVFIIYLPNSKVYKCLCCQTPITAVSELISKVMYLAGIFWAHWKSILV